MKNLVTLPWGPDSTIAIYAMFLNGTIDGFVMDAPAIDKFNSEYPCTSFEFTDPIVTFNYGILYNSTTSRDFIKSIDLVIFDFKESPDIQNYAKKYIYVAPLDNNCNNISNQLTLDQLSGLWIILASATFAAIILDRVEAWWSKDKTLKLFLSSKLGLKEMDEDTKQDILESYLMITDYIHIPSNNIHLRIEDDIKKSLDLVENSIKDKFSDVEKKVVTYLTSNCRALGLTDIETNSQLSDDFVEDIDDILPKDEKEKVD